MRFGIWNFGSVGESGGDGNGTAEKAASRSHRLILPRWYAFGMGEGKSNRVREPDEILRKRVETLHVFPNGGGF